MVQLAVLAVLPLLAQAASPPPAAKGRATPEDIRQFGEAFALFEETVDSGKPADAAALNVCRLALSQSLRGVDLTSQAIIDYKSKGRQLLSRECEGYYQAATDILQAQGHPGGDAARP